jgi:hypothetical protein
MKLAAVVSGAVLRLRRRRSAADPIGKPLPEPEPARPITVTPPEPSTDLVGRTAFIGDIESAMSGSSPDTRIWVLHGLAGVGKSAVVIDSTTKIKKDNPDVDVWWLNAAEASHERTLQPLWAAARRAATPRDEPFEDVAADDPSLPERLWETLRGHRGGRRWIIVVDNANNLRVFGEWEALRDLNQWVRRPGSRDLFLVTTCDGNSKAWNSRGINHVRIPPLTLGEAKELLVRCANDRPADPNEAGRLAGRLYGLPAVLQAAGLYLADENMAGALDSARPNSYGDYSRALDDDARFVGLRVPDDAGAEQPGNWPLIARVWELSLKALDDQGGPLARHLFRLLSHVRIDVDPAVLAGGLLQPFVGDVGAEEIAHALKRLKDFGLVEVGQNGVVGVPPIMGCSGRIQAADEQQFRTYKKVAQRIRRRSGVNPAATRVEHQASELLTWQDIPAVPRDSDDERPV